MGAWLLMFVQEEELWRMVAWWVCLGSWGFVWVVLGFSSCDVVDAGFGRVGCDSSSKCMIFLYRELCFRLPSIDECYF